jgi:hypothetical protein
MMHSSLFQEAIRQIDGQNSLDPNSEIVDQVSVPRELLYSKRLTEWIMRLSPDASETLLLAARAQHLCRWEIPRDHYPRTRTGYLQWREALRRFHADKASTILQEVGFSHEVTERVASLILKKALAQDEEAQILEDAVCLSFLENQFENFAKETDQNKMIQILQKTLKKMSARGRSEAMKIRLNPVCNDLLKKAVSG